MNNNFEKPSSLDELEKKLYSPNQNLAQKERKHLNTKEYDVPQDWEHDPVSTEDVPSPITDIPSSPNWFFRFFILAFIFFVSALGYVGFKFYIDSGIDASNVDVLVNAPLTIGAGESFDFEVVLQNKNQIGMRYVDIGVQFPDGTRSITDIGTDYTSIKDTVNNLAVGEIVKKNYNALLFGEESDKKEISVFLTYQIEGSTVLFRKEKKFDVVLKSTPIRLTVTNVKEITSGQELAFTIELVSNSTQTLKNVMVQAVYPFGFMYKSSTLAPKEDKKSWIIPTIAPRETITFTVKGDIEGQNTDEKFFKFLVGLAQEGQDTPQIVFSTKGTTVSLARPFLELGFDIDQKSSEIIVLNPSQSKNASITFKNNTDSAIRNAAVSLLITGDALREEAIQVSEGFFQSLTNTIIWDQNTANDLSVIDIGSSGSLNFVLSGLGFSPERQIINPEVTFVISAKGNRNLQNQVSETIENSIIQKIRFNTEVDIDSWSDHYSPTFLNSGPIPPVAEQKTTYTSNISIKNTSNIIADSVVTMKIPRYVQYEGVFSPQTENVTYDSVNRTVIWGVGDLATKTGYVGNQPRTLSLNLSIIPSISQVATAPILVEEIKFKGLDTHTQQTIEARAEPISTQIMDAKDYYDSLVSK